MAKNDIIFYTKEANIGRAAATAGILQTLLTAGTEGTKVKSVLGLNASATYVYAGQPATSLSTPPAMSAIGVKTNTVIELYINKGAGDELIGKATKSVSNKEIAEMSMAAFSPTHGVGMNAGICSFSLDNTSNLQVLEGFPLDAQGNPYLNLEAGWILKAKLVSGTSDGLVAYGENY